MLRQYLRADAAAAIFAAERMLLIRYDAARYDAVYLPMLIRLRAIC